jgi:hypothetical protein
MKSLVLCALAVLALSGAASANVSPLSNAPAAYTPDVPVIEGTVVTVTDLSMVVHTTQGEEVTVLMDSRTLVPNDLAPGMVMRAEFKVMENGSYYAKRVVPIRGDEESQRRVAYAHMGANDTYAGVETSDDDDAGVTAVNASHDSEEAESNADAREDAAERQREASATNANQNDEDTMTADNEDGTMPNTAGNAPLLAVLGVLALVGGGLTWLWRPRRA